MSECVAKKEPIDGVAFIGLKAGKSRRHRRFYVFFPIIFEVSIEWANNNDTNGTTEHEVNTLA